MIQQVCFMVPKHIKLTTSTAAGTYRCAQLPLPVCSAEQVENLFDPNKIQYIFQNDAQCVSKEAKRKCNFREN